MKPDGGAEEKGMEATEVEPSEFFVELGLLILESRLPIPSVKGRQDGPHCPPALGDRSCHVCDVSQQLCKRALEMQRQMQALWRNHIPMCIEVLLFPDCSHGQLKAAATDAAPPVAGDGCVLLEQWTIQFVGKKPTESCISSKALFQAMRSYLHFSQLSAWLNLTHGNEPRHVGYRVSPPAEFCTTTFHEAPESHLFPLAFANKSTNIKVTLAHLPRLPDIPKPVCGELTGKQPCGSVDYVLPCRPKSSSPVSPKISLQVARSDSPKLDKPNVLHALSAEEREMLTRPSKCLCAECVSANKSTDVAAARPESNSETRIAGAYLKSSPNLLAGSMRQKSPELASDGARPVLKDAGAIPKRFSLQLKSVPEDLIAKHPRSPQHSKSVQMTDGEATSMKRVDLKQFLDEVSDKRSLPLFLNHRKDLIPEVLPSLLRDSTDSSGSSPDYDHFLSKTLMQQSEPLSLQEMELYLQRLYQPGHDLFRGSGLPGRGVLATAGGKLKQQPNFEGEYDFKEPLSSETPGAVIQEDDCSRKKNTFGSLNKSTALKELNMNPKSCESVMRVRPDMKFRPDYAVSKTTNFPEKTGVRKPTGTSELINDNMIENVDMLGPLLKPMELKRSTVCYCDVDLSKFRPVFTLGDAGENDEKCLDVKTRKLRSIKGECDIEKTPVSCVPKSKCKDATKVEEGQPMEIGVRGLHKSISCPSKPALKNNCTSATSKVNSLLKTIMKKELIAQQNTVCNEGRIPPPPTSPCVPTNQERIYFRRCVQKSASMVFHTATGLPLQSSPVPAKKMSCGSFDYDSSLNSVRAIKNSLSCIDLDAKDNDNQDLERVRQTYSTSAPASTNCLLGNFEESLINGRIEPIGVVNGFTVDIGASGSFCPQHVTLPVTAFFFSLSEDNAPSPYLGHINLESCSKRGYHIPKQGTIQVTLFNPNKTVVKMFVVKYDMSDMPPCHQTVLRQRTLYMPVKGSPSDVPGVMVYLRYLIHLRFASSKSNKIYLHTDIRVIFARDKFELDSRVANYELRSFTEGPENPKFSPRK